MIVLSVALASAAGSTAAQEKEKGAKQFISIKKSEIKWQNAPSIGPGAKTAVIEGDPKSAGPFTMRIQAPANTKIGVHTHPADEKVTVLDGTLYFSTGDKFDPKKATAYYGGDAFIVPQGMAMYAFTKNKPATLQIHGMGPWGITYMDPADDPMKQAKK
jgi:quercetin dioxygenase-like cupin family protein